MKSIHSVIVREPQQIGQLIRPRPVEKVVSFRFVEIHFSVFFEWQQPSQESQIFTVSDMSVFSIVRNEHFR
jgi:hypothetical protein